MIAGTTHIVHRVAFIWRYAMDIDAALIQVVVCSTHAYRVSYPHAGSG